MVCMYRRGTEEAQTLFEAFRQSVSVSVAASNHLLVTLSQLAEEARHVSLIW